jgi:adenylate kinase
VFLQQRYHLHPLSPGDLLRQEVRQDTEVGRQARSYMDAGQLVPDEIILRLVAGELDRLGEEEGFLLDGFPRSEAQAELLDKLLAERHRRISSVLLLEVEDGVILKRLSLRRVCPSCSRSYNLADNPPTVEGLCDLDGTPLVQRSDDSAEVIEKRLQVYHQSTAPVIGYYRDRGLLRSVDADQPIESVRQTLQAILDLSLAQPPNQD